MALPLCLFDELPGSGIFSLDSDGQNESTVSQQFDADVLGAVEHSQPCDSVLLIHHNVQGLYFQRSWKSHNGFIGVKTILLFCVVVRPGLKISHYCQHSMGIRGFILLTLFLNSVFARLIIVCIF